MADQKITSVQDYIESHSQETKQALMELRKCILEVAPNAIEMFNHNIPAYALISGGKREQQTMMAGYEKHVGLYPHPTTMEKFATELVGYKKGKGSVQFHINKPLPVDLIKRMVQYRLELLNQKH
jgi:uncharacterized protein YdhG (YjbR/CyaY superfamily)